MFHSNQNPVEPEYTPLSRQEQEGFEDSYETGNTKPPKRQGCFMAGILLAAVLCGSVASLSLFGQRGQSDSTTPSRDPYDLVNAHETTDPQQLPTLGQEDWSTTPTTVPDETEQTPQMVISPVPGTVPNIPQEGGLSLQEIYAKVSPSTVSITAMSFGGSSYGSGIIMTESGYIITNCHVVDEAASFLVTLHDGTEYPGTLVGKDQVTDLAVLKIQGQNLTPAQFGDSDQIHVGDLAVAIGDPLGLELRGTMTEGIISAINRNLTIGGREMTLLQTTAALNEGNSGGPLINCHGQVVGINTAKIGSNYNQSAESLGFAIPINLAKEVVDQLISVGYVPGRPSLGVETAVLSFQYRLFYDLPEGLYIAHVQEGSHAWNLGLRKGDTILSIDGHHVTSQETLNAILSNYQAGDRVHIVIYRSHRQLETILTLQEATG